MLKRLILRLIYGNPSGFVNVYKREDGSLHTSGIVYKSIEDAEKARSGYTLDYLGVKRIYII